MSIKIVRWAGPLFLSFLLLTPPGCATVRLDDVVRAARDDPEGEKGKFIEGVPFFPQNELMCGPAALASVLNFYGHKADLNEVSREVYRAGLKGSLSMDLFISAKERGFDVRYYRGGLEDLKARLRENSPLIVFVNLGYDFYPVGHYMVVVGYNDDMEVVVAHSGTTRGKVFAYGEFLDDWGKTGFSTLLIKPKPERGVDG
jgi:ABC-type bacteriocin/lantibiotic exporter with double-glycine peptidase domain